jgi:hypothetical protein
MLGSNLPLYSGPSGGQATIIEIETKYTKLCMEKTNLEAEQARLGRSVRMHAPSNLYSSGYELHH